MKLSSSNNFLNHMACIVALELAMYSASVEESTTISCFFEDHAMAPPPMRNTYPETDQRSIVDDAQSASEYPSTWMSTNLLLSSYVIPKSFVPCR